MSGVMESLAKCRPNRLYLIPRENQFNSFFNQFNSLSISHFTLFPHLNNGQTRPLSVYICPFSLQCQILYKIYYKSADGVHGIRIWHLRIEGAAESTELWWPPRTCQIQTEYYISLSKRNLLQFFVYFTFLHYSFFTTSCKSAKLYRYKASRC